MRHSAGLCSTLLLVMLAGAARAEIVNATGKVDWLLGAPADARLRGPGSIAGSMLIRAWDEAQNITLARSLTVDAHAPGLYTSPSHLGTFTIGAGEEISSHALLLKPPASRAAARATIAFASEIIGVIVSDATSARRRDGRLSATDDLGSSTFDAGLLNRGLELGSDWFEISPDRLSITFSLNASNPGDLARVITRSSESRAFGSEEFGGSSGMILWDWEPRPIPAPGSLAVGGIALLASRRRRPGA